MNKAEKKAAERGYKDLKEFLAQNATRSLADLALELGVSVVTLSQAMTALLSKGERCAHKERRR